MRKRYCFSALAALFSSTLLMTASYSQPAFALPPLTTNIVPSSTPTVGSSSRIIFCMGFHCRQTPIATPLPSSGTPSPTPSPRPPSPTPTRTATPSPTSPPNNSGASLTFAPMGLAEDAWAANIVGVSYNPFAPVSERWTRFDRQFLLQLLNRMNELGFSGAKMTVARSDSAWDTFRYLTPQERTQATSPKNLLQTETLRQAFNTPIKRFIFTAYPFNEDVLQSLINEPSVSATNSTFVTQLAIGKAQFKEAAKYLFDTYNGTGKQFMFGGWEETSKIKPGVYTWDLLNQTQRNQILDYRTIPEVSVYRQGLPASTLIWTEFRLYWPALHAILKFAAYKRALHEGILEARNEAYAAGKRNVFVASYGEVGDLFMFNKDPLRRSWLTRNDIEPQNPNTFNSVFAQAPGYYADMVLYSARGAEEYSYASHDPVKRIRWRTAMDRMQSALDGSDGVHRFGIGELGMCYHGDDYRGLLHTGAARAMVDTVVRSQPYLQVIWGFLDDGCTGTTEASCPGSAIIDTNNQLTPFWKMLGPYVKTRSLVQTVPSAHADWRNRMMKLLLNRSYNPITDSRLNTAEFVWNANTPAQTIAEMKKRNVAWVTCSQPYHNLSAQGRPQGCEYLKRIGYSAMAFGVDVCRVLKGQNPSQNILRGDSQNLGEWMDYFQATPSTNMISSRQHEFISNYLGNCN